MISLNEKKTNTFIYCRKWTKIILLSYFYFQFFCTADKRMPMYGIGAGALSGVCIVIADLVLTENPVLKVKYRFLTKGSIFVDPR